MFFLCIKFFHWYEIDTSVCICSVFAFQNSGLLVALYNMTVLSRQHRVRGWTLVTSIKAFFSSLCLPLLRPYYGSWYFALNHLLLFFRLNIRVRENPQKVSSVQDGQSVAILMSWNGWALDITYLLIFFCLSFWAYHLFVTECWL